jgi:hypothetical protein
MSFPFPVTPKPSLNEFEIYDESIGEGNFSSIKRAKWIPHGLEVAIKIVSKSRVERIGKQRDVLMEKHALMRYI